MKNKGKFIKQKLFWAQTVLLLLLYVSPLKLFTISFLKYLQANKKLKYTNVHIIHITESGWNL